MWICEKGGNCVDPCDERCGHYIEVEPVVHGRWVQKDMFAKYHWMHNCSICGSPVYDKTKLYNYCPNCGARMDGE